MPTLPAISPNTKDWIQAATGLAAAVGAIVAAFKFWSELRLGREQRSRELRWKQAEAGKTLNDEMLDDPLAWPAMQMLDYGGTTFELPSKAVVVVSRSDLWFALDPRNQARDEKDMYIRKCFDSLFYYMATMEHYTSATLVDSEDIAFPLEYYVPLLADFRGVVDLYVDRYHLDRVKKFLNRYPSWRDAVVPSVVVTA
jgi:hypothetical protein